MNNIQNLMPSGFYTKNSSKCKETLYLILCYLNLFYISCSWTITRTFVTGIIFLDTNTAFQIAYSVGFSITMQLKTWV
jgi:hypothetical protein